MIIRIWIVTLAIVMVAACSKHQPPVQMMAEARAAIQAAHGLKPSSNTSANTMEQADIALHQATLALGHRNYDQARKSARTARDLARQVIQQSRQANQSE